jgi:hypothetical protein
MRKWENSLQENLVESQQSRKAKGFLFKRMLYIHVMNFQGNSGNKEGRLSFVRKFQ